MSEAARTGEPIASGDRSRSAPQLQSTTARFPRSEPQASGEPHQAGFTLIEMLAVVMMFGLIAAMVLPNINLGGSRVARGEGEDLAAAIEFARQRAVMTGRTHRVVIEVERGEHWVEWTAPPDPDGEVAGTDSQPAGEKKLDLVPPPLETEEFVPIPGELGRVHTADDKVAILGVEIDGGVVDQGRIELVISPDGVAEPASILVGDADGSNAVRVEVQPLADAVQVVNVE